MVTTRGASDFSVTSDTAQTQVDPQDDTPTAAELKRQQAIAQLAAELRKKKVAYAKRPKVKYLTASTREYAYAAYMRGWSDRVERVGNLNYPERARSQGLHGDVLLTVVLNLDGSIKSIDVIQSSGQKVLDDAARRIVRLAAPFPPAPKTGEHIDELNITRTWRFQPNNVLKTR
jgi:protein TonB